MYIKHVLCFILFQLKFVTKKRKIKFFANVKKGSKLYSILTGTCPKCQKESMYLDQNPLHLSKILKMKIAAIVGFNTRLNLPFYGAMYVSYGLNVAIGIATFIISYVY
jgi:hypothetical protein